MSAQQVADMIRNDQELKKSTILYRDLMARGHEKAAKEVKENTPQVAVSFKMEGGKGKENCGECLYHVMIDFDAKNPDERLSDEELERVIYIMRTSNKVRLGYESISGLGYHIVVAFVLPDGITIDMKHDAKRSEEIYTRAYRSIANLYSVYCGHQMDMECKNVNRMMGLSHDPNVVCCPNARYFRLTREQLGIDADGNLIKMKTPRKALDKKGNRISIHLGDNLERAVKMVEESGINFTPGNRHNFVMRLGFILNRMGVDEDEAAEALDDEYLGRMDGRPSGILHSCYKSASDEFGIWIPSRSSKSVNTDIISNFLKKYKENRAVQNAMYGIRPASVAMITYACLLVARAALLNTELFAVTGALTDLISWKAILLGIAVLASYLKFKKHPIVYILGAAVIGIVFRF